MKQSCDIFIGDMFNASTAPVYVQVRLSGVPQCARIRGIWVAADGADLLAVDLLGPMTGRASVQFGRARPCSGVDGCCVCAGEVSGDCGEVQK